MTNGYVALLIGVERPHAGPYALIRGTGPVFVGLARGLKDQLALPLLKPHRWYWRVT